MHRAPNNQIQRFPQQNISFVQNINICPKTGAPYARSLACQAST